MGLSQVGKAKKGDKSKSKADGLHIEKLLKLMELLATSVLFIQTLDAGSLPADLAHVLFAHVCLSPHPIH